MRGRSRTLVAADVMRLLSAAASQAACIFLLLTWSAPAAAAASFDCTKAQSRVEKAICADAEVSALDEYLARYYSAARSRLGRAAECMRSDQMQWLRAVRN